MVCPVSKNGVCAAIFDLCTHPVYGVCTKVCSWCVEVCKADLGCVRQVCAVHVILKYVSVEVSSRPSGGLFTLLALCPCLLGFHIGF